MKFKDCLDEFESLCMFCAVTDSEENFDNDNDICKYDNQKTEKHCPGFVCNEQCRKCDLSCEMLSKPNDNLKLILSHPTTP